MSEQWMRDLAGSLTSGLELSIAGYADVLKDHVGSPIELRFATAFWAALRTYEFDCNLLRNGRETEKFQQLCEAHRYAIALQYPWRTYRSDMCLGGTAVGGLILLECDGHDFHERTKEQAAHDRRRDLLAQQDGFSILRFTGSQIHKDLYGCIYDVMTFVAQRKRLA
jgi:very-short-patch-repair endonuclease